MGRRANINKGIVKQSKHPLAQRLEAYSEERFSTTRRIVVYFCDPSHPDINVWSCETEARKIQNVGQSMANIKQLLLDSGHLNASTACWGDKAAVLILAHLFNQIREEALRENPRFGAKEHPKLNGHESLPDLLHSQRQFLEAIVCYAWVQSTRTPHSDANLSAGGMQQLCLANCCIEAQHWHSDLWEQWAQESTIHTTANGQHEASMAGGLSRILATAPLRAFFDTINMPIPFVEQSDSDPSGNANGSGSGNGDGDGDGNGSGSGSGSSGSGSGSSGTLNTPLTPLFPGQDPMMGYPWAVNDPAQGPMMGSQWVVNASGEGPMMDSQWIVNAPEEGAMMSNQWVVNTPGQGPMMGTPCIDNAAGQRAIMCNQWPVNVPGQGAMVDNQWVVNAPGEGTMIGNHRPINTPEQNAMVNNNQRQDPSGLDTKCSGLPGAGKDDEMFEAFINCDADTLS